jgi:hypothetical protein
MRRARIALVVFAGLGGPALLAPTAASPQVTGPVCTTAGCVSGVFLVVQRPPTKARQLTFCVNEACTRLPARNGASGQLPCPQASSVEVVVIARRTARKRLWRQALTVPLKVVQPNGPVCGPTCYTAGLTLDRGILTAG